MTLISAVPNRERLSSLDVARGCLMVVSILVASVLEPRPDWLRHARWSGVTFYDLIFPAFVAVSGAGLALAHRRRVSLRVTVRRFLVLMVAGLIYNALGSGVTDLAEWRVTGVLQSYALLTATMALTHLAVHSARAWAVLTAALATCWALTLRVFAAGCPGGTLTPECNPSRLVDPVVFSTAHLYSQGGRGHDPEGLVAFVGLFLTAAVGATIMTLLIESREGRRDARTRRIDIAVVVTSLVLATSATAVLIEPMKRIWTPSFALLSALPGVALLLVWWLALDRGDAGPCVGGMVWPLVALGRNALLVYFGSHLVIDLLVRAGGSPSWAQRLAFWLPGSQPQAAFVLLNLVAWSLLAAVLHRLRLYARA